MKTYIFKNPGLIDIRCITTMGVSVKSNENPIGFFGTGLKYAISVLLRNNCKITIFIGKEKYEFSTKTEIIKGVSFELVLLNNKELSFTTDYGKKWELWQAVRELYSNCLDENGTFIKNPPFPYLAQEEDFTAIILEGELLEQVMDNLGDIFIAREKEPIFSCPELEIFLGKSSYIYYRGVRAYDLNKDSLFTYNIIKKLDLTEDRSIKYQFEIEEVLISALSKLDSSLILKETLTADKYSYESTFCYDRGITHSKEFVDIVFSLRKAETPNLNISALMSVTKQNKEMEALLEPEQIILNSLEKKRLEKAIDFLKNLDINISEYPVKIVESLGVDVLGQAKNETIYISRLALDSGTKILAGTLAEEYFHLKHHLIDCTYQMQNFLFNKLMTLGELYTGEPL